MLADVGFVACLAWVSAGVGSRLQGRFARPPVRPDDALAQAIPLGLGVLALCTLALGLLGRLDRTGLGSMLAILAAVAARPGTILVARAYRISYACVARAIRRGSWIDRALLGWTTLALLGSSVAATLPVTDGDALCYHLQVPKVFLARKAVVFEPDLHETVYPLITEMLDAIALAFRGPVACRWLRMLLGLVFAANVTALARPFLRGHAWWAGAVVLLVPAVSNGMCAPLNDVALAAFGAAAIVAATRSLDRPTIGRASLAGCFAGLALGVKYPALVLLGLLFLAFALRLGFRAETNPLRSGSIRRTIGLIAAFGGSAIAFGGVWYLRAYLNTGNPVFPYFRTVFGGSGLDEVLDPTRRAMTVNPWNVLTAIVPMTLSPDRFESFAHQFGPAFLLFLPALVFERPPRRLVGLLLIGYAFLTICVTQRQSTRFVLTALGPLAVGVAYQARAWSLRPSMGARLILGILVVALGLGSIQALARGRNGVKMLLGRESAEQYLTRLEPTYPVGRWVDRNLPGSARLIGQDHRGFYIPRDYTMELAHRRRTGLGRSGETATQVIAHMRREGFTHLLLCPPVPEDAVEFDPTLGRILGSWTAERAPLYRRDLVDADGITRRYAIYSLGDAGDVAPPESLASGVKR